MTVTEPDVRAGNEIFARWGMNVMTARVDAGLTQNQLAERVGSSQQSISRIERGRHGVSDRMRQRIAKAVGKPVAEIFTYDA